MPTVFERLPVGRMQSGFTYLGLLFAVALIGVSLAAAGVLWATERQREREQELLFVGNQIREAIGNYYLRTPGTIKHYPPTLDDLLKDSRTLSARRYLRRPYVDPMTNSHAWGLVRASDGGVMGVFSLSSLKPIKQSGFLDANLGFEGATRYSDWKFIYWPAAALLKKSHIAHGAESGVAR